jgi:ATP-dependent DNA helicase RecG
MNKTELLEIVYNGENSGVEFKRDVIQNYELARELVAFANFQGGVVLLGVEDDGSIFGTTRAELEEWVMTTCRAKIRPEIIPYFQWIRDVEAGKHVAVVQVERGWAVHSVWHNQRHGYYIRVGSQSREPSPEELERLFQQRGTFRVETRPVSGSSIADLDLRRLGQYFEKVRTQETPALDDQQAWQTLLVNTEVLCEHQDLFPCTVAGLLLFGRNPNRFIPQSGIDAAAYPGPEKVYNAIERQAMRGPLVGFFTPDRSDIVEAGLVEQAIAFIKRNTKTTAELKEGRRVERPDYPEQVLREGTVNALVHRDYLLSATTIEISIYSDRLEIISPGRLPNGITPARMKAGCRSARNQLITDVMRDYGYLEHMGMGIPRQIIRGMLEHTGREPDLVTDNEQFLLRLWK